MNLWYKYWWFVLAVIPTIYDILTDKKQFIYSIVHVTFDCKYKICADNNLIWEDVEHDLNLTY